MQKILDKKDMPAFPVPERDGTYIGLTKWEYFAAHAPKCPEWFGHVWENDDVKFFEWRRFYADRMCNL